MCSLSRAERCERNSSVPAPLCLPGVLFALWCSSQDGALKFTKAGLASEGLISEKSVQ